MSGRGDRKTLIIMKISWIILALVLCIIRPSCNVYSSNSGNSCFWKKIPSEKLSTMLGNTISMLNVIVVYLL